ncbi:MAG: DNA-packaging protein [Colwellia sp.]|nr:DNA-packaging protein [Colwellia sp.]
MAAEKGNQYWKTRKTSGRKKKFTTPNKLWKAACKYFEWCENNPLLEEKAFAYQGKINKTTIAKMRAMTIKGLCIHIGVSCDYFTQFESALDLKNKQDKDFSSVIHEIKDIIFVQKFEGASADLLNANIIARELGLADKHEVSSKNVNYELPADSNPQEAAQAYMDAISNND